MSRAAPELLSAAGAIYPFAAVVGQEPLKRALLLCAVDPALGGVLIRGPRGVAKTTLARALGELVPGEFVELPLGATEERVVGTLDLQQALREQRVAFAPGLLARAHRGVLYVDEVNLLPDALVDLLLDAAASGRNVVERDGISHAHEARFALIGTMNPEEGELRPQFVDRFGLSALAQGELHSEQRAQILAARLAFERDPAAFREKHRAAQTELAARCARARTLLADVPLCGPALQWVAERCAAAGVDGMRADLAMLRAARAHAAWHGRTELTPADVEAVAELALAHRRRTPLDPEPPRRAPAPPDPAPAHAPQPPRAAPAPHPAAPRADASPAPRTAADPHANAMSGPGGTEGDSGARPPLPVALRAAAPRNLAAALAAAPRGAAKATAGTGRRPRGTAPAARGARDRASASGPIDWFATLARTPRPRPGELRRRARRTAHTQLWIAALDCSGSMLRAGALAAAAAAVHSLATPARRAGAALALIECRAGQAHLAVPPPALAPALTAALSQLGAGGGTSLRAATRTALALARHPRWRAPRARTRLLLFTDGRTREPLADLAPACAKASLDLVVIDCERARFRLGAAPSLAHALGARCLHIDTPAPPSSR